MRPVAPLWLRALALCIGSILTAVFAFILFSSADSLWRGRGLYLLGTVWSPQTGRFGIAPMIHASLLLSFSALCCGWLLSLGCCCVLRGLGPKGLRVFLSVALRFMSSVPTVVYGFTAVFLLVPLIRESLGGSGFCGLTAGIVLAFQGVPAMTLVMDEALRAVNEETAITAAALGLTPSQNLSWVVIPASRHGLASAAVLGFGRALGDTLLPTMLAGNAVQFASSPLDSMRALTAHIGLALSSNVGGGEAFSLLLAGGLLLLGSAAATLLAHSLFKR